MTKIILTILATITIIAPKTIEVKAEEPVPLEQTFWTDYEAILKAREIEYEYNKKENILQRAVDAALEKREAEKKAEEERIEAGKKAEAKRVEEARLVEVARLEAIEEANKVEKERTPAVQTASPVVRTGGTQTVKFTNYYTGDSTGSSGKTGSGHTTSEFGTNHRGMYTYNGDVVLAGATTTCLNITTGVCGQYNYIPNGFAVYDYYDRVSFTFSGEQFTGVILDTCGACFWELDNQVMDIFVSQGGQFGTQLGEVHH